MRLWCLTRRGCTTQSLLLAAVMGMGLMGTAMAQTVQPITWNVVGLDSNNVAVGPNVFPVGARVCNTSGSAVADGVWQAKFNWVGTQSASITRTSPELLPVGALAAGACRDVFHEVTITRDPAAYDQRVQYNIEVVNSGGASLTPAVATPINREIYVERLISQNRNAVLGYVYNGNPVIPGGSINVAVGQTFDLTLNARTATQGYEQLEKFIELNPTLFRVNKVTSTYSANSGTDPNAGNKIYADGCGWQNDITAISYHNNLSCSGTGKYGGNITQKYNITVLAAPPGAPATTVTAGALVYDFSGSSYHYNGDFGSGGITFIFDGAPPTPVGADIEMIKSVVDLNNGNYTFFLKVKNLGPADATSVVVTDNVPDGYTIDNNQSGGWDGFTVSRTPLNGPLITWTVGNLTNGAELTLPVKVNRVNGGTDYVNTATVTSSNDPNPTNNSSSVVASPTIADLVISKTTSYTAPLKIGDQLTFTVSLANLGGAAATGVVVEDTVPAGYAVAPGDVTCAAGWSLTNPSGSTYRCSLATVPVSLSAVPVMTIVARALAPEDPTDLSAYLNVATVTSTSSDPNAGNNTASASQAPTFLTIVKGSSADVYDSSNSTGSYTLTVTKNGTTVDLGVLTVVDALPVGVTATAISGTGWSCTLSPLSCTRPDDQVAVPTVALSPTAYPAITIAVSYAGPSQATLVNRASVTSIKNGVVTSFDETSKTVSWSDTPLPLYTVVASSAQPAFGSASCTPGSVLSGGSSTCTAVPAPGYRFVSWSGACLGATETCALSGINTNKTSVATFELIPLTYTVTANTTGNGTASCTPSPVSPGGSSTCTAAPAPGYRFVSWSGACAGAGASCALSGINTDKTSVAVFELIPLTYTVTATTTGNGTASCTPSPVSPGGSSTCTATPAAGQEFAGWTGACEGQGPVCTLSNINADQASVAAFRALAIQPVPTLSQWAMLLLAALMGVATLAVFRKNNF